MDYPTIIVVDYDTTCAAGVGLAALSAALDTRQSGLVASDQQRTGLSTWVGAVAALDDFCWPEPQRRWQSRNNALIDMGIRQGSLLRSVERLKATFSPSRIGIVMGSSTSSIDRSEAAYRERAADGSLAPDYCQPEVLNPHAPGLYLGHALGLSGPNMTINTACSSSAKVFATAHRWLTLGLVDAVVVGGADTLCLSVLHGFHSLQLVSPNPCRPYDVARDGINLGEAAGFAILAREGELDEHSGIRLSGYGESSDAHHMSHPHPEGEGARLCIEQALTMAALHPGDIGYINLHGTASKANDRIEGTLIRRLFGDTVTASSTKGWTGHTLGAAGILESIIAIETLRTGLIPGTLNFTEVDPAIGLPMSAANSRGTMQHVMSNSFGFGGNNACLIFSKEQ